MLAWQPLRALARIASRPASPLSWTPFSSSPAPPAPASARAFSASSLCQLVRKPTKIKLKTHQGAAKRWRALANGQFKRAKVGRVHLNSSGAMSSTRLNRLGETAYARPAEKRILRRLLPYA
ncbi:mitochondrial 54S ribosomal protein bL35m MRP35 [Rhodotorula paludigena]|uniref:mitochondrial 54S ribosomal protein bL35m MRP35 n=1 Tax=Rhodotorula paludigena TaxID=86838 RepID=UPI00316EDEB7